MARRIAVPKYCLHKASNRAYVFDADALAEIGEGGEGAQVVRDDRVLEDLVSVFSVARAGDPLRDVTVHVVVQTGRLVHGRGVPQAVQFERAWAPDRQAPLTVKTRRRSY